jgi:protein TilB
MPPITEALLRKRSEHNDGLLTDLQEIALHQEEIECIPPMLQTLCRHLKILLLQNNVISRIENVHKLKELEYLNVALNSIDVVENLGRCESLKKLDLTVNFIDLERLRESALNLSDCSSLEDLYFVGNPCNDWPHARLYLIGHIPWLKQLDGTLVTPSERLQAKRLLSKMEAELKDLAQACFAKKQAPDYKPNYSREERLAEYRVLAKQKAAKDNKAKPDEADIKKEPAPIYNTAGEVRQCNEGKYDFLLDDWSDAANIVLTVQVPKFMDTSQIDVDVNARFIRCVIKGKVLQLALNEEVGVSQATVKRARTSGELKVTMPKVVLSKVGGGRAGGNAPVVELKTKADLVEVKTVRRTKTDEPPPLEQVSRGL